MNTFTTAYDDSSPAIQFLKVLWNSAMTATPHSYDRLNQAMRDATSVAILGGLNFNLTDFKYISFYFRFEKWGGASPNQGFGEHFYSLACKVNNLSACRAYEAWADRKPFILDGKRLSIGAILDFVENPKTREKRMFEVTSFAPTGLKICMVSYKYYQDANGYQQRSIEKRKSLTLDQIRELSKTNTIYWGR